MVHYCGQEAETAEGEAMLVGFLLPTMKASKLLNGPVHIHDGSSLFGCCPIGQLSMKIPPKTHSKVGKSSH